MRAWQLSAPQPVTAQPLALVDLPDPALGDHDIRIRVRACGVCHTDLHIVEGEIPPHKLPVVPGQPPDLSALPAGCPFAPRCEFADEQCGEDPPFVRAALAG